jgi:excisionase family DNA binding protein
MKRTVRITIEIEDEAVRRVLGPLLQTATVPLAPASTKLLTINEVADHLGISRSKVYQLVSRGDIKSLAIGRNRRVSPAALAEFINTPREVIPDSYSPPRHERERSPIRPKLVQVPLPKPEPSPRRRGKAALYEIDLSPKPFSPDSRDSELTAEEWERGLAGMVEKGWPEDVVDQMRADRREGVRRVPALSINDTARFLGLSRYGIEKLVRDGKLRLFTPEPIYRDDKPEKRIPAKDILALK